jgi:predicted small lipoprotein YifL
MRLIALIILTCAVVTGCGYKGPLYLPQNKPKPGQTAPQPAPQPVLPPSAPGNTLTPAP